MGFLGVYLRKTYTVGAGETDCFGYCRPGALQNYLQDAATRHSEDIKFSREDLPGNNVWVMTDIRFWTERPIRFQESVEVATWHRGSAGVRYYRDFDLFSDNRRVGEGISAWVIVDMESGKITRPRDIDTSALVHTPENAKTQLLSPIQRPEDLTFVGTRTAVYTDIDINGHVNNVRYCDIACDALALCRFAGRFVRDVRIRYLGQTMPGQTLSLYTGRTPKGGFFVTGRDESDCPKFDAILEIDSL